MYVGGLAAGTRYGFAVKAVVNGEVSVVTSNDIVYVTTESDGKPAITKAVQSGEGVVALNWSSVNDAQSYKVYYRVDGKWTYAGERTGNGMYVKGLVAGKTYGFAVKAVINGKETEVTSKDIVYVTMAAAKPAITKAVQSGEGVVALNWSSVNDAQSYKVYYRVDGKWTYAGERTGNGMYVKGLVAGKTYGFAVKAVINGKVTDVTSKDIVYVTVK